VGEKLLKKQVFRKNIVDRQYGKDALINDKNIAYIVDRNGHFELGFLCGDTVLVDDLEGVSTSGFVKYERMGASEYKTLLICVDNVTIINPTPNFGGGFNVSFKGGKVNLVVTTLDSL